MMRARAIIFLLALTSAGAHAAEPAFDLDISTPAIERIKAALAARAAQITHGQDFGYIGEGTDGLLAVRSRTGLSLAEKKVLEDAVAAQNRDRRAWYREILRAHGLANDDRAPELMKLMAARLRSSAAPGHFVVHPASGKWVKARDIEAD